jgi:hypothetical protein
MKLEALEKFALIKFKSRRFNKKEESSPSIQEVQFAFQASTSWIKLNNNYCSIKIQFKNHRVVSLVSQIYRRKREGKKRFSGELR